jgi:hypothetical protein
LRAVGDLFGGDPVAGRQRRGDLGGGEGVLAIDRAGAAAELEPADLGVEVGELGVDGQVVERH